jgi:F-type H+-transporting ATPase subunit d
LIELKEAEKASIKELERIEKEIAEMKEMKVRSVLNSHGRCISYFRPNISFIHTEKISTMTSDEYFQKHPELKQKFDDEIHNDYWGY